MSSMMTTTIQRPTLANEIRPACDRHGVRLDELGKCSICRVIRLSR